MTIEEKIDHVLKLYHLANMAVARYKRKSGLRCTPRCCKCCTNCTLTATQLELLPLAFLLYKKNKAVFWLEKLREIENGGKATCIFLKPLAANLEYGRCTVYKLRPMVCRLFGYSAVLDKHGQPRLVTCREMKQMYNLDHTKTACAAAIAELPVMKNFYIMLSSIDFELSRKYYPFNEALIYAIENILTYFSYHYCDEGGALQPSL